MVFITEKTKHTYRIIAIVFCSLFVSEAKAQTDPIYTQYLNNMCIINPAYTGLPGYLNATVLTRQQWTGYDDAPKTNSIMVNSPVKGYNIGVGGSLIYDTYGPVTQTGFYADYAYRFRNRRRQYFSFGIKAGFNLFSAGLTDLDVIDPNDPLFQQDIKNKVLPNVGLGFMWHGNDFFLGAAVPKIIQNEITDNDEVLSNSISAEKIHAYIMGAYVFKRHRYIQFKPSMLIRYVPNSPISFDINAHWFFYEELWVGVMYRFMNSFGTSIQYQISDKIKVGYAYDCTTLNNATYSAGTHEFLISYDMGFKRRRRYRTPRYF